MKYEESRELRAFVCAIGEWFGIHSEYGALDELIEDVIKGYTSGEIKAATNPFLRAVQTDTSPDK